MAESDPQSLVLPSLVTMGHPGLARPAAPVPEHLVGTRDFDQRLDLLIQSMVAYEGIGIAAPQVGWFERFFLMVAEAPADPSTAPEGEEDAGPPQELVAWINPRIVEASEEWCWAWEGCLSVPGLRGWIRRPAAVAVQGLNPRGEPVSMEYRGWNARVFQHEYDHLEGMLYPYRAAHPHHLVMTGELERREEWPDGWPATGARDTPPGELFFEG